MTLSRREAVVLLAKHPRSLMSVDGAREMALAFGHTLDGLLIIAPDLVRAYHGPALLTADAPRDLVQVSDLGATVCMARGLYANASHAMQSPHGTLGKQADYVGRRAAIRLARAFWGEPGVRDLLQDVPEIPKVLRDERVYRI